MLDRRYAYLMPFQPFRFLRRWRSLSHATPYTVAMANSGPDTDGSQWYVTEGNQSYLDGSYSIFGTVTSGQAICEAS